MAATAESSARLTVRSLDSAPCRFSNHPAPTSTTTTTADAAAAAAAAAANVGTRSPSGAFEGRRQFSLPSPRREEQIVKVAHELVRLPRLAPVEGKGVQAAEDGANPSLGSGDRSRVCGLLLIDIIIGVTTIVAGEI